MVDCADHLDMIEKAAAGAWPARQPVRVCIDIDAGFVALGGRLRAGRAPLPGPHPGAGGRRWPPRSSARPGLRLAGLMAYEAQIAGVGDNPPGQPLHALAIRIMQRRSAAELAAAAGRDRRGGAGRWRRWSSSTAAAPARSSSTAAEPAVTEIGAGIRAVPAPAVRQLPRLLAASPRRCSRCPWCAGRAPAWSPRSAAATSPPAPANAARLPCPYLPAGLRLDRDEGAGEVQTPLLGAAADGLRIGDRVWIRHAKAGELCERFNELHLIEGDAVVETVPTYRGEGQNFPLTKVPRA